ALIGDFHRGASNQTGDLTDVVHIRCQGVACPEFHRPYKGERSPSSEKKAVSRCGFLQWNAFIRMNREQSEPTHQPSRGAPAPAVKELVRASLPPAPQQSTRQERRRREIFNPKGA